MKSALDLATRLLKIADALVDNRTVEISNETLRMIKEQVICHRMQIGDGDFQIDYEASCLIDCISALAYARTDKDKSAEDRAIMYINTLRHFMQVDVTAAMRRTS